MPDFFCGVDVGGSNTRVVIADAGGSRVGVGHALGANPSHVGWEGAGQNVHHALLEALEAGGIALSDLRSIFIGMASVVTSEDRARACALTQGWGLSPSCLIRADHDIRIALHGGLTGRTGLALIAGTGSSCFGRNKAGESWQSGGWDQLLDDLGSSYDLARQGMAAACQCDDGRLPETCLKHLFFEKFDAASAAEFSAKLHRPPLARHIIASHAHLVLAAAQAGDLAALRIACSGATELARMVEAVTKKLFSSQEPELVFIGGLIQQNDFYAALVRQAVEKLGLGIRFSATELSPVAGAWIIAAEQAGADVQSTQFLHNVA